MTKAPTNHARRINALLKKTTFNGCEPASALGLASTIVTKHGLNSVDFAWPEPPAGWRWEGTRGHGGTVVEVAAEPAKPRAVKAKKPAAPKAPRVTAGQRLAEMAARPEGFTIEEMMETFGILEHSARALVSTELRKRRGINIVSSKGRYTVAPSA